MSNRIFGRATRLGALCCTVTLLVSLPRTAWAAPSSAAEPDREQNTEASSQTSLAELSAPESIVREAAGPRVHIESSNGRPLELYRVRERAVAVGPGGSASAVSFDRACDAPCDLRLPTLPDYFIAGPGVTASSAFRLPNKDEVDVHVRPGSRLLRAGGWTLATLGVVLLTTGATLFALSKSGSLDRGRNAGIGMLAGGSVGIAVSIPMIVFGRTRVELR